MSLNSLSHVAARGLLCGVALMSLTAWPLTTRAANWSVVATACTPGDRATAGADGAINLRGGFVRSGRNPPRLNYVCAVPDPKLNPGDPPLTQLRLQARDPNAPAGNVKARLFRKARVGGKVTELAVVLSTTSDSIAATSVPLPSTLNFELFAYYIVVELGTPIPGVEVEAHMVSLEP